MKDVTLIIVFVNDYLTLIKRKKIFFVFSYNGNFILNHKLQTELYVSPPLVWLYLNTISTSEFIFRDNLFIFSKIEIVYII